MKNMSERKLVSIFEYIINEANKDEDVKQRLVEIGIDKISETDQKEILDLLSRERPHLYLKWVIEENAS